MTSRFIESVGRGYANDTLNDSVFMYEGEPYILRSIERNTDEDDEDEGHDDSEGATFINCATGEYKSLPQSLITGWKSFKYPKLGYRSFGQSHAAFITRTTSYSRGLNESNCRFGWSPMSRALFRVGIDGEGGPWRSRVKAIFSPQYHTKDDMEKLFHGEIPHVVFSGDAMIELPVRVPDENHGFDVFFRGMVVGQVRPDLTIHSDNQHNRKLTERIVKRHAY